MPPSPGTRYTKQIVLATALLLSIPYLWWVQKQGRAATAIQTIDLPSFKRAVELEPGDAHYHHLLGRLYLLVEQDIPSAIHEFQTATELNPHDSQTWLDLAIAERMQGDLEAQGKAVEQALRMDPRTPQVAWDAANFLLSEGQNDRALEQFRTVLESDPTRTHEALELGYRAT